MLGWNLFLLMHFSTVSKISSQTWFIKNRFSFIFNPSHTTLWLYGKVYHTVTLGESLFYVFLKVWRVLKKNCLKNLLPRRDISCSQNGNVGKLRDQNLILRFFGRCLSYLVIRRMIIERKIYWLLKITYIECLMNKYTTHILWSELWIVTSKNKNLLQNVLFWMVQFVTNFFVQSFITFWTFQSSVTFAIDTTTLRRWY